jgi:hypothetical protein
VSAPTLQTVITRLAKLSGTEAPDVSGESPLGVAVAECHLTSEALKAGKTWTEIAAVRGWAAPVLAKRHYKRLDTEVRRELAMRASAN